MDSYEILLAQLAPGSDGKLLNAALIVGAAVAGAAAIKFLDRLRRKDVENEARMILEKARQDIANRKKEGELEIKEEMIKQRGTGFKRISH